MHEMRGNTVTLLSGVPMVVTFVETRHIFKTELKKVLEEGNELFRLLRYYAE